MIIDVTFEYGADIRRGRKRKDEGVTLGASVPVHVAEHDAADCPVAAWWSPPRLDDKMTRVAVRLVDGVPAEPVLVAGGGMDDAYLDHRGAGQGLVLGKSLAGGFDITALYADYVLHDRERPAPPARGDLPSDARVVSDGEDNVASQVRAMLSDLCLVDGVLHRRGGVPALEADGIFRTCRPRRIVAGKVGRMDVFDATKLHRLDRWEDAFAESRFAAGERVPEPPTILLPSAFDIDLTGLMAAATAERLADMHANDRHRDRRNVGSLPTPALMAWVDVRDLSRAGAGTADLLDALRSFQAACDEGVRKGLDFETAMLDRCLARSGERGHDPDLAAMTF